MPSPALDLKIPIQKHREGSPHRRTVELLLEVFDVYQYSAGIRFESTREAPHKVSSNQTLNSEPLKTS